MAGTKQKGFLYYVTSRAAMNKASLEALGLGPVFGKGSVPNVGVTGGPDGKNGVVFVCGPEPGQESQVAGYFPDKQEWVECVTDGYWLGWAKGAKPGPEDLARASMIPGYVGKLNDDGEFLIPILVSDCQETAVPKALSRGTSGKWDQETPLPQYAALCRDAEEALPPLKALLWPEDTPDDEDPPEPLSREAMVDLAIRGLQVNYRLGPAEVNVLGLLTTHNIASIVALMIDIHAAREMSEASKKNDGPSRDSPDTGDGGKA
jgi:hypothetical protein